jgi:hypothetical protein
MQKNYSNEKISNGIDEVLGNLKLFGEPEENITKNFFKRQGFVDVEYLE